MHASYVCVTPGRVFVALANSNPASRRGGTLRIIVSRVKAVALNVTAPSRPGDVFVPGASAQRTADRLTAKDQAESPSRAVWLNKASIFWRQSPSKAASWNRGAEGERLVGSLLNQLQNQGLVVAVHDIHVPGTSANVDHVAVAASGIHVIDAKYYKNKQVEIVDRGGFLRRDVQLRVAKRNRTNLVDKLAKQILLVDSVTRDAELPTVVTPVLCFVHALWGVFKKEYELKGVHIVPATTARAVAQATRPPRGRTDRARRRPASLTPPSGVGRSSCTTTSISDGSQMSADNRMSGAAARIDLTSGREALFVLGVR